MTGKGDEPSTTDGLQYPMVDLFTGWHNVAADVHKRSGSVVSVVSQCSIGIPGGVV